MQLAQSLQGAGPRNVILKLGDRGAYVLGGDGEGVGLPRWGHHKRCQRYKPLVQGMGSGVRPVHFTILAGGKRSRKTTT
jgi:hypothetical protein